MTVTDRPPAPRPSPSPSSPSPFNGVRPDEGWHPGLSLPQRPCRSADRRGGLAARPGVPTGGCRGRCGPCPAPAEPCRSGGPEVAATDLLSRWRRVVELSRGRCGRWEAAWEDLAVPLRPLLGGWIHHTLAELGRPPLEADELIQDVYLKLLAGNGRLMRNFNAHSEGQLRSYLRRTCQSCVQDALRRALASKRGRDQTVPLGRKGQERLHSPTADPERRAIRRSQLAAFRWAVAECAESLFRQPDRNRWIFEQAILEGRSSASIGRELGLGTSGVDSVVSRIRLHLARQGWEVDKRAAG